MGKNYCVYIHRKSGGGDVFYVGIGTPKRPYDFKRRSKFWKYVVEKYGYDIEVLHKGLSWESARDIEIQLIEEYGRRDLDKGTLVNLTDGGEGAHGRIENEYTKKRRIKSLKEYYSNNNPPMLGKHHSEESKRIMSDKNKKTHYGENHPRSKLCKEDIEYIRENYIRGDKVYGVIGMSKTFGVSKGQISKIINRKRWV